MKNLGKRILSMLMVVVMCITTFVNLPTVNAYADSNNRIATYINLAKSKEVTDVDVSGLTEDQLRFLGVWLSNYFSPFMMEITGDSELTDSIKEEMAKALTTNLSFSEDLAKQLVEIVYGYMKATAKPIYIAIKEGNTYKPFNEDGNLSYATFIAAMSGGGNMLGGGLSGSTETKKEVGLVMHSVDTDPPTPGAEYHTIYFTVDGKEVGGPICSWSDLSTSMVCPDFTFYRGGVDVEWTYNGTPLSSMTTEEMKTQITSISSKLKNAKSFSEAHAAYWSKSTDATLLEDLLYSSLSLIAVYWSTLCNDSDAYLFCANGTPFNFSIGDEDNASISYWVNNSCLADAEASRIMTEATINEKGFSGATSSFPADEGFFVFKAEDGSYHPVANFYASDKTGTFTDSQLAFAKCLASGNPKMGYGYSITDFTKSDIGETQDNGYEYLVALQKEKSLTPEQVASMTTYGTTMCVDCFGNIIQAGGVHQRVIMPACMNPYAWIGVNSDGTDKEGSGGQVLQGANFIHVGDLRDTLVGSLDSDISVDYSSFSLDDAGDNRSTLRAHINSNETQVKWNAGGEAWNNSFLSSYILAGSKDPLIAAERQQQGIWWAEKHTFVVPVPTGEGDASDAYTNVVLIDTLGAYDTGSDFNAFNVASFKGDGDSIIKIDNASSLFSNALSDVDKPMIAWGDETAAAATCLYITYCWASLYDPANKEDTIGKLGYRLWAENLPSMKNKGITLTFDGSKIESDIVNWLYYILHPTKGFNYVVTWLTNKVNHFLLNWHSSMVGTNGVGAMTGTTKYRSHYGYVTTPDLSEIQWTDSLINLYNDCVPFLIVILLIIMVFAYLTGVLNLQHAIIGWLMFAIFTVMPVNLINTMVGESNRISQNIYGDKFTYWALIQNETYANAIDTAVQGDGSGSKEGYENYLRTLFNTNSMVYSNQGGESVLVKWQAPKKMASLVLSSEDAKSVSGLGSAGRQMLQGMLNKSYSGQSYVNDEDAVYMYRSYLDITNFSRYIWKYISAKGTGSYYDVFKNTYVDNATKVTSTPEDVVTSYTMTKYFPMNIDVFNFGITSFNQDIWDVEKYFAPTGGFENDSNRISELKKYINNNGGETQLPKLAAHALYSENTYYYFSWKLYSDGLSPDSSISGSTGFKDLLLGDGKGGYFYDVNGSGALLDVMDMRHLFTDVIPYMKKGNDIVRAFDDVYGIFIYDGVPTEEGHWNDADVSTDPEWKAKYWHNLNVSRLYGVYCPWVDVMYDCSYAKPQKITVMGKSFVVQDPINPQSYTGSGRPMIFSEAEMEEYGLSEGDLTTVERLILKANKGYTERLFDLLNYYNFSDVSLNAAAAINCAFEFNSTFSESGIFSNNHNIYPQSFDLANFSYDAYLRFILSNTTNESMLETSSSDGAGTSAGETSGDFYERIVNNSSMTTVLVMLLLDVVSIYVLPAFRIFFLVAMFFTSFIIILVSAFRIEDNLNFGKKVAKQFFLPLILYFVATVVFSWVLSLFMGTGNNAVTQTNQISISMGDPVMVMLVMLALDIILLIIYWKIISMVIQDMKHGLKMVGGFISGLGGAAVGAVSGALAGAAGGLASGLSSGGTKIKNAYNGKKGKAEQASDSSTKPAQKGTGVENARANERGANGQSIKDEARDNAEMSPKEKQEVQTKTDAINKKAENGEISTVQSEKKVNLGKSNKDNSVEVKTSKEPKQNSGNSNANGGKKGKSGSIEQRQLGGQGNQSGSRKRSGSQRNNQSNGQKPNNNKGGQNVNRNNGGQKNRNNSNTKKRRSNNNGGGGNKGYRPQSGGRNRGKKS